MSAASIGKHLVAYLEKVWGPSILLESIEQIPGGASRETYRVHLQVNGTSRRIILRRDPITSLIDTERSHEYRTYEAVHRAGFPVPKPLLLEEGNTPLERPFSLMEEVAGCESALAGLSQPPFDQVGEKIAARKWTLMGQLSRLDIDRLGLKAFMQVPQHAARHELDYWSEVIHTDALHPQPVAEATIRWLHRNLPPATEDLCLVHGDFRTGNFLYNASGEIPAVLDWEMAHIGDPLEDLAWSCDPLWGWPERHLAGGLLAREKAIQIWEAAAGRKVDRERFRWWQVFASLKALAIWISSTEDYANGTSKEPILAVAGWLMTDRENRILVDRLHPAGTHTYTEGLL